MRAAYHAPAMALPLLLMLLWRSEATGGHDASAGSTGSFKWEYFARMFRDRWEWFDLAAWR